MKFSNILFCTALFVSGLLITSGFVGMVWYTMPKALGFMFIILGFALIVVSIFSYREDRINYMKAKLREEQRLNRKYGQMVDQRQLHH